MNDLQKIEQVITTLTILKGRLSAPWSSDVEACIRNLNEVKESLEGDNNE